MFDRRRGGSSSNLSREFCDLADRSMSRSSSWLRRSHVNTSSMKGITVMTREELAGILAKPYAQQLLNGPEPARMAYVGLDGDPRVIPIGFWTEGEQVVMATVPKSAKVAALRKHPKVALTIDQGAFPPKVLLIRGTAAVELVQGIP